MLLTLINSEALMALPSLPTLKHEHSHHAVNLQNHHHHHHHHSHHSGHTSHNHINSRNSHSENSSIIDRKEDSSPLLHTTNTDDNNRPVAIVHGKKNRLTYCNEDEIVPTAIKRFCLNNEREANINHEHKFLLTNNAFLASEDECNDECANDIRCQHRHSSSVPDLRTTSTLVSGQSHSTASSPSSSSTPTPTTSSVLSQILATQQFLSSPTSSPNHELIVPNRISTKFQYILSAATSMAVKIHEETMTYLNQGIVFYKIR
jgi:hypothetical protein